MIYEVNPIQLFSMYMQIAGVPHLEDETSGDPRLIGKTLGIINGGAWIILWAYYFGRKFLPGVRIINVGNEAVQLNFMKAHKEGKECPPQENIEVFKRYALDIANLYRNVDVILISCSTMNRAYVHVQEEMKKYNIPVLTIDMPMMEEAVKSVKNGKILIIATHGPTVKSTQALLEEVARDMNKRIEYTGETIEEAFEMLGKGDIEAHNELIARAIKKHQKAERIDVVILAQLSMTVFKFSYPDDLKEFGIPVLTSGECGFKKVRDILIEKS